MANELLILGLILCIGQGLTFSLLLLFKAKGVVIANRLLAAFILLTIIPLWNDYIRIGPEVFAGWHIRFTWINITTLYGPLLFLYTFYYLDGKELPKPKLTWFWLSICPLIGSILILSQLYLIDGRFSIFVRLPWLAVIYIQTALCIYFALKLVWKYEQNLKQNFSNLDKDKTVWLKQILVIYFVLLMIGLTHLIAKLIGLPQAKVLHILITITEAIFIFMIGFWGVNKSNTIFHDVIDLDDKKYRNSGLDEAKAEQIIANLNDLMTKEELYLDNEISLSMLAERLDETPHNVSQALNESLKLNFYDYINFARIERAQKMLTAPETKKLAIIDIAYQVGFNNKASFNNSFKKFTQKTPSQFRSESLN